MVKTILDFPGKAVLSNQFYTVQSFFPRISYIFPNFELQQHTLDHVYSKLSHRFKGFLMYKIFFYLKCSMGLGSN